MSDNNNNNNDNVEPFLHIQGQPIYFQEDWGAGIGGGLWSTGAALAKYFDTDHAAQQIAKQAAVSHSTSFLEVGSGNGLLSVCWMALLLAAQNDDDDKASYFPRQHKVVLTDTAEHLTLMRQTIDGNPHIAKKDQFQVLVQEHLWGVFDDDEEDIGNDNSPSGVADTTKLSTNQTFDYIVGSDVAYRRELYEPLIASLQRFAHDQTVILLGCTMEDTTPKFFDLLRQAGFDYRRMNDVVLPASYRGQQTFGIFVVQRRVKRSR